MALSKPQKLTEKTATYYYDMHPTHEDLLGKTYLQSEIPHYLRNVLNWLYRDEDWFVIPNFNIYCTYNYIEYPLAPALAVYKGVKTPKENLRSWKMILPNRPAPTVVFEICSEESIRHDMAVKPELYGQVGVKEYFAYDPNEPPMRKKYEARLYGWRYTGEDEAEPIEADEQGRLWSVELESWLVAEQYNLRLYDREWKMRLTKGEQYHAEAEQYRAERMRLIKEREQLQSEVEATEHTLKEKAWAKLRELGIDPEKL